MRFYRIEWDDPNVGACVRWETDKSQARWKARRIADELGQKIAPVIREMDVPQKKKALRMWLNTHFTTDNG